jgi:hypothetical protein
MSNGAHQAHTNNEKTRNSAQKRIQPDNTCSLLQGRC